jgi:hypothetical protein
LRLILFDELTLVFMSLLNLSLAAFLIIWLILDGNLPWEDQLLLFAFVDSLNPRFLASVVVNIIFLAPQIVLHNFRL